MKLTEAVSWSEFPYKVACPVCEGTETYVHIEMVEINAGGTITRISRQRTEILQGREPSGRGTSIRIVYWCECDHRWETVQQFHKGETLLRTTELLQQPSELWRD